MSPSKLIQIVYVYENEIDSTVTDDVLASLEQQGGRGTFGSDYHIGYWDENGDLSGQTGDRDRIAELMSSSPTCTVSVAFEEFVLSVGRDAGRSNHLEQSHLLFDVAASPFRPTESVPAGELENRRQTFIAVLAAIAETTSPLAGFGGVGEPCFDNLPSAATIREGSIDFLFEYNVFSESTVDRLGRESVLETPAWHVKALSTGGAMLIVPEIPRSCEDDTLRCDGVSEHLGLPII